MGRGSLTTWTRDPTEGGVTAIMSNRGHRKHTRELNPLRLGDAIRALYPAARTTALAGVFALVALPSCGPDDDDDTSGLYEYCDTDDRHDEYEPGMVVEGGLGVLSVELLEVDPMPIDVGGSEWLVRIVDPTDGVAVEGCAVVATPWMPDHAHAGTEGAGLEEEPGVYRITGIRYVMAGFWETKIKPTCGELEDEAVFPFCLRG